MKNDEEIVRAYSMASYPAEGRKIMLNESYTPPWDRQKNDFMDVNPGVASSYIFNCKAGDKVTISGPYENFSLMNLMLKCCTLAEEQEWLLCVHIYMSFLRLLKLDERLLFLWWEVKS